MTTTNNGLDKPSFLIEMSHQLRHIIMKRSYFLRSTRTSKLLCREKIAGKSWLEVAVVEKLKTDVFVEPAQEPGRYHQLTAVNDRVNAFAGAEPGNGGGFDYDPLAGLFGGSVRRGGPAEGQFGMPGISGLGTASMPGMPNMPNIPGMPNIGGANSPFNIGGMQNPADFLPAHVREALSLGEKSSEIILPALRGLPAFCKLPEATGLMYEVEAVQVLQSLTGLVEPCEHSEQSLVALTKLDNVSKRLKRFLAEAVIAA